MKSAPKIALFSAIVLAATSARSAPSVSAPQIVTLITGDRVALSFTADGRPLVAFDPEIEAQLASPAASPERSLLDRERAQQFHHAVEGLSDQQRRCLFLRLEGLRYPEIAATLGISASAVGEFLRRAIVRLKKATRE